LFQIAGPKGGGKFAAMLQKKRFVGSEKDIQVEEVGNKDEEGQDKSSPSKRGPCSSL
jgi:hypothetical protein